MIKIVFTHELENRPKPFPKKLDISIWSLFSPFRKSIVEASFLVASNLVTVTYTLIHCIQSQ